MRHTHRQALTLLACVGALAGLTSCGSDSASTAASAQPSRSSAVAQTKPLQFRTVLGISSDPCPTGKDSYFTDPTTHRCLHLAAPAVTVTHLRSAQATTIYQDTWAVQIELEPQDRKALGTLTTSLSHKSAPQNSLAMVLGSPGKGRLLSAPEVMQPIKTGRLQITGGFTKSSAEQLAHSLGGS